MFFHFVKKGDNLYNLSKTYNIPLSRLIEDNNISNPNNLSVGESLIIRKDPTTYVVKKGDTIAEIAKKFNISIEKIRERNNDLSNTLFPGQSIIIDYSPEEKDDIHVNGYTYPTISDEILKKTLPYLTYLSIFAYRIKEDGTIDNIDDKRIIDLARTYNVAPLMVITNTKEKGGFSPSLVNSLLTDEDKITTFLNLVLKTLEEKNYYGVNIDFEYINENDKDLYESFMKRAYTFFSSKGYLYSYVDGKLLYSTNLTPVLDLLTEPPDTFKNFEINVEEVDTKTAREYIELLQRTGLPSSEALSVYYKKYSFPSVIFLVVFLSIGLSCKSRKNVLLVSLILCVCAAVAFYVLQMITMYLAKFGYIPAITGGWFPVVLFTLISIVLMKFAKT